MDYGFDIYDDDDEIQDTESSPSMSAQPEETEWWLETFREMPPAVAAMIEPVASVVSGATEASGLSNDDTARVARLAKARASEGGAASQVLGGAVGETAAIAPAAYLAAKGGATKFLSGLVGTLTNGLLKDPQAKEGDIINNIQERAMQAGVDVLGFGGGHLVGGLAAEAGKKLLGAGAGNMDSLMPSVQELIKEGKPTSPNTLQQGVSGDVANIELGDVVGAGVNTAKQTTPTGIGRAALHAGGQVMTGKKHAPNIGLAASQVMDVKALAAMNKEAAELASPISVPMAAGRTAGEMQENLFKQFRNGYDTVLKDTDISDTIKNGAQEAYSKLDDAIKESVEGSSAKEASALLENLSRLDEGSIGSFGEFYRSVVEAKNKVGYDAPKVKEAVSEYLSKLTKDLPEELYDSLNHLNGKYPEFLAFTKAAEKGKGGVFSLDNLDAASKTVSNTGQDLFGGFKDRYSSFYGVQPQTSLDNVLNIDKASVVEKAVKKAEKQHKIATKGRLKPAAKALDALRPTGGIFGIETANQFLIDPAKEARLKKEKEDLKKKKKASSAR